MIIGTMSAVKKSAQKAAVLFPVLCTAQVVQAEDFTAEVFMRDYDEPQRSLFLAGLIEGLAQARYERDGNSTGAQCIYDWFYKGGKDAISDIEINFIAHETSGPAAIVSAMLKRECGG